MINAIQGSLKQAKRTLLDMCKMKLIDGAITTLNLLNNLSPNSIKDIMFHKVELTPELENYCPNVLTSDGKTISTFGLINSLFGLNNDGRGYITAVIDDNTSNIIRFEFTKEN